MKAFVRRFLLAAGLLAFSSAASAALIATIAGNDCSGVFGQGFNDCKIPAQYDPNQSPIIIKFEFDDNGNVTGVEIADLFPTIDGTEFAFVHTSPGIGSWTYTPGAGDPSITFFVAKGGPGFNLFSTGGLADNYQTPANCGAKNNQCGLSHLSFYDTGGQQIVEPATLLLFGIAAIGAALARRRRS
jgi:hypothetical protein